MNGLRLNLGCGMKHIEGYVNVDRFGEPDVRHDLEVLPWPWPDDSVSEVPCSGTSWSISATTRGSTSRS